MYFPLLHVYFKTPGDYDHDKTSRLNLVLETAPRMSFAAFHSAYKTRRKVCERLLGLHSYNSPVIEALRRKHRARQNCKFNFTTHAYKKDSGPYIKSGNIRHIPTMIYALHSITNSKCGVHMTVAGRHLRITEIWAVMPLSKGEISFHCCQIYRFFPEIMIQKKMMKHTFLNENMQFYSLNLNGFTIQQRVQIFELFYEREMFSVNYINWMVYTVILLL